MLNCNRLILRNYILMINNLYKISSNKIYYNKNKKYVINKANHNLKCKNNRQI